MERDDLTEQVLVKLRPADAARFEAIAARVGDKKGALGRKVLLAWLDAVEAGEASPGAVTIRPPDASPSSRASRPHSPQPEKHRTGGRAS